MSGKRGGKNIRMKAAISPQIDNHKEEVMVRVREREDGKREEGQQSPQNGEGRMKFYSFTCHLAVAVFCCFSFLLRPSPSLHVLL